MNTIEDTRHRLEATVIGLKLRPFAKAVRGRSQLRCVLGETREPAALLDDLVHELRLLAASDIHEHNMQTLQRLGHTARQAPSTR